MNTYPRLFTAALNRRNWDVNIYGPVYDKCATAQKLMQADYYAGQALAELGFMTVTYKPMWKGDQYCGTEVWFQSYVPVGSAVTP